MLLVFLFTFQSLCSGTYFKTLLHFLLCVPWCDMNLFNSSISPCCFPSPFFCFSAKRLEKLKDYPGFLSRGTQVCMFVPSTVNYKKGGCFSIHHLWGIRTPPMTRPDLLYPMTHLGEPKNYRKGDHWKTKQNKKMKWTKTANPQWVKQSAGENTQQCKILKEIQ